MSVVMLVLLCVVVMYGFVYVSVVMYGFVYVSVVMYGFVYVSVVMYGFGVCVSSHVWVLCMCQ